MELSPRGDYDPDYVDVTASPSLTLLRRWSELSNAEKKQVREREGRPFGFARALDEARPKVEAATVGAWHP